MSRIKEALSIEALFELVKSDLQGAETDRFNLLDIDLVLAALLKNADAAAHGNLQAVFRAELDAALLLFEEDTLDLSAVIFQGEVDVTGLGLVAVGDFALNE